MASSLFTLHSPYVPTGDQPKAIAELTASLEKGNQFQTLLWVTGSGKTFTMANIIANLQRPALVIAHNKTLAAQLAQEFKEFFPENAVHYFVSYYDYYQPEAFVVKTGSYIEKEATINEEIDRLRHAATESLLSRRDVIIVASVSCIYGIGEATAYENQTFEIKKWEKYVLENLISSLVLLQFRRASADFKPWMFRVLWDTLEIWPSSSEEMITLEFFWDELERISRRTPLTYEFREDLSSIKIYPAKHFVTEKSVIDDVVPRIKMELDERIATFLSQGKLLEAERIKLRVEYDIEMLSEVGYVNGVENYSMYLSGKTFWDTPSTLLQYFPKDFLTFIDESHISIPQIGGMYAWDRARKMTLVDYGFRLPSALENRPLRFEEFESKIGQTIFVSATPWTYEAVHEQMRIEQVIRPTGLVDPLISVERMEWVVDSLMREIDLVRSRNERALITTITKKSSEDLATYLAENGVKVKYLHSEIETIERLETLREYRLWEIDVIVWVNLLREWLDLPETSFIGILDAEKIGFLRSKTSLLQIIGRAARNVNGHVIMYSHKQVLSPAMRDAIAETEHRRSIQIAYNTAHAITPKTIISSIKEIGIGKSKSEVDTQHVTGKELEQYIKRLELEMDIAAANLNFEEAAKLRDELIGLRRKREKTHRRR